MAKGSLKSYTIPPFKLRSSNYLEEQRNPLRIKGRRVLFCWNQNFFHKLFAVRWTLRHTYARNFFFPSSIPSKVRRHRLKFAWASNWNSIPMTSWNGENANWAKHDLFTGGFYFNPIAWIKGSWKRRHWWFIGKNLILFKFP